MVIFTSKSTFWFANSFSNTGFGIISVIISSFVISKLVLLNIVLNTSSLLEKLSNSFISITTGSVILIISSPINSIGSKALP